MNGIVYLVGAGPGDPGLLTRRAAELLQRCDVVAYDELVSDGVLQLVSPSAELVPVGHRGKGDRHAAYRIHPAIVEHAQRGARVVRLKCGDPFIFGRGGEEADELLAAGIPFEVVPGVSSALGAAAYAAMPLTHRDHASDVTWVTGHDLYSGREGRTDWRAVGAGRGTLVLYMAARRLADNLARLVEHGRSPSTPAAYVAAATTSRQRTIVGTLGDLAQRTSEVDADQPALIIVGEVVSLRQRLHWLEQRPLHGRRVLVARARPGESAIAAQLRALGAEVTEAPTLTIEHIDDHLSIDSSMHRPSSMDALLFACADGVDAFLAQLGASGGDLRAWSLPIVAIGKQARDRLRARGVQPALFVPGACKDALGAERALSSRSLLLITSDEGRPNLVAELRELGATVETLALYRVRRAWPRVCKEPFDAVVLPSSSAATHLYRSEFGGALTHLPAIAMGPLTEAAARRSGALEVLRSDTDSVDSLVARTCERLTDKPTTTTTMRTEAEA